MPGSVGMSVIADFERWRAEILELGAITQEDDDSVSAEEAEARFNRYIELVRMIEGTEGPSAVEALVSSMRSEHDWACRATHGALALFPLGDFGRGTAMAIPFLVEMYPDHSGEVLAAVARDDQSIREFHSYLPRLNPELRAGFADLIRQEELDGWLFDEGLVGKLRP